MFNVTVIKLKDMIRYLVILAILMLIFCLGARYLLNLKEKLNNIHIGNSIENLIQKNLTKIIEIEFPEIKLEISKEPKKEAETANKFQKILETEISAMKAEEKVEVGDNLNVETAESTSQDSNQEELELAKHENVSTEIVTQNPINETYTQEYNGVQIRNETGYNLTDDILNPDSLEIDKSNILIFHTHTCESYTASEKYNYVQTGNFRTTDLNYTVARVGDELEKYLLAYCFNVRHDKTYHDYPSYTGSYNRSLSTVQTLLKQQSSDIIIDLHRDAIGSNSNYDPTVKIGDDYAARLMFVIGTDGGGLEHTNWKSNLKFAVKIQEVASKLYPGLFKPIIVRNSRYNQHLGKAACIIEVGSTGNTLDQSLTSMKYLSEVINKALNE